MKIRKITVLSLICLLFISQTALAGRSERSDENKEQAMQWCADYLRSHPGTTCHVVKMAKLCPSDHRRAKRFKQFRSRGYKACIPGKKGQVVKQVVKNFHKPVTKVTKKTTLGIGKATKKSTKKTAKFIKKSTKFGVQGIRHTTPLP